VVVRSHDAAEAARLERESGARVFVGETELARAISAHVLARMA